MFYVRMKRLTRAAVICAAALVGSSLPSNAADLGVVPGAKRLKQIKVTSHDRNWRDRCAWANHYCLYAWDGYVYHYPWHDPPSVYARSSRRHRY
jgi:hypothetical protein